MLTLPIEKKWLDMILAGDKLEEYRDLTPYYHARLERHIGLITKLRLRNGYSKDSVTVECAVHVSIGEGIQKWGAEPDKKYYVLRIICKELIGGTE